VTLSKLTSWQNYHRLEDGSKVMLDASLSIESSIYHRLEWKFAQLIFQDVQLRLSPVRDWKDPYESWWCEELFERQGSPLRGINAYALCWTLSRYDEPAWRMVGYGRSEPIVRITRPVGAILEAAKRHIEANRGTWFLGKVRYRPERRLRLLSERLSESAASPLKHVASTAASLLIRKRKAFRFEEEVRLIFLDRPGAPARPQLFLPIEIAGITDVMTSPYADRGQRRNVIDGLKPFGLRPRRSSVMNPPAWVNVR